MEFSSVFPSSVSLLRAPFLLLVCYYYANTSHKKSAHFHVIFHTEAQKVLLFIYLFFLATLMSSFLWSTELKRLHILDKGIWKRCTICYKKVTLLRHSQYFFWSYITHSVLHHFSFSRNSPSFYIEMSFLDEQSV